MNSAADAPAGEPAPSNRSSPKSVAVFIGSALAGVVLGLVAQHWFFTGTLAWMNLVLWGAISVSIGLVSHSWKITILACAVNGFAIVFTFSIAGYQGSAPLQSALLAFLLLAAIGAAGMATGGAIGHLLRRLGRGSIRH